MNAFNSTANPNIGKDILSNALSNLSVVMNSINTATTMIARDDNWEVKLASYVTRLTSHVDEIIKLKFEDSENISLGQYMGSVRDVALVCASSQDDNHPLLDILKSGSSLNYSDAKMIRDALHSSAENLTKETVAKEEFMHVPFTMAAMGIILTKSAVAMSKKLQEEVQKRMDMAYYIIAGDCLVKQLEKDAMDLLKADSFAEMLTQSGVVFNKSGDPVFSEKFLENEQKKAKYANSGANTGTEGKTSPGTTV